MLINSLGVSPWRKTFPKIDDSFHLHILIPQGPFASTTKPEGIFPFLPIFFNLVTSMMEPPSSQCRAWKGEFLVPLRATPCVPVRHDRLSVSSWGCTMAGSASQTTGCVSGRAQCFLRDSPPVLREQEHPPSLLRRKFLRRYRQKSWEGERWMVNRGTTVP